MTASCGTRTTPPRCQESPFSSWSFVGILLVALVLQLPTFSDACGAPPRFQTMKLTGTSQNAYSPGDTIKYECYPGYMPLVPLRNTTAVCQADNTWTPLQEACTRKSCPQLGDPINGEINGNFLFGSQVHYTCNEGFYLLGPQTLYCEISGNSVAWDNEPPTCEKILCKPPAQIPNGKYTNSHKDTFEYNEVVTYSCNPSGGPDEYSLVGESQLICSGHDSWNNEPPECKVVKCPHPKLKDGEQVSGFAKKYYYNAKVLLQCNEGFSLQGSKTIVCGASSTWEPAMPECIKGVKPTAAFPTKTTSPGTSGPSPTSGGSSSKALGPGAIAGIVIGSLVVILTAGVCAYKEILKRKKKGLQEN